MKTSYILLLHFFLLYTNIGYCQTARTNESTKKNSTYLSYKKLYEELHKAENYTKSEDEFYQQFGTPEGQQKLYKALNDAGYYTKSLEEFKKQFFSGTHSPEKDSTNSKYKSNQTSIYSFLKKNNLTVKSELDFYNTYSDSTKAKELYDFFVENKLTDKDFDSFYKDIFPKGLVRRFKSKGTIYDIPLDKVQDFLIDMPNAQVIHSFLISSNLKLYNNLLESKRVSIEEIGNFETFNSLLLDTSKAIKLYENLKRKGFKEDEIGNLDVFLANINKSTDSSSDLLFQIKANTQSDTTYSSNLHFQIDKIKVGNSYIELPFPSGFVKVDDSIGNLLEAAKKLCPETNTLLAYYISEEDYANYLVDENHICEKYILIEVYNELKDIKVGAKDYRQFLKKHKEEYIDEFKLKIDDAEIKASENLSKIDERLKMKDFNIEPFGICYESKYSLSYGILTKYNFTVNSENSGDYIVAGISTITKIDKKPIFLFLYKTYNRSEDIQSLKALNTSWIEEIDKRQSPGNFLAEIDFEDYKESILAILTLSFIWAIYFATKKIHRKLKNSSEKIVAKVEEKNEFLDFNELLHEDLKINDELAVEEKVIDSQIKPESPKESFKIFNPEFLKVNRRTRFYNWLIDAILFYFIIYLPLFLYNAIINPYLYLFNTPLSFKRQ